jgi:hypothetical protein
MVRLLWQLDLMFMFFCSIIIVCIGRPSSSLVFQSKHMSCHVVSCAQLVREAMVYNRLKLVYSALTRLHASIPHCFANGCSRRIVVTKGSEEVGR